MGVKLMPSSKEGQASITVRCTAKELEQIKNKAAKYGFKTYAEYIRFISLNAKIEVKVDNKGSQQATLVLCFQSIRTEKYLGKLIYNSIFPPVTCWNTYIDA
eukprot:TRINITY_DN15227_c0_g2_i1.p5 TRINITY_DN15227_c0_g2~~TRINITY_DN15227_c0_g2_i1.p5  ORF type:complete len:102 (-),score=0.12 TRINITY_DN15227_c0_g2_i1:977-1282(-)